jgi:hypothetical protein
VRLASRVRIASRVRLASQVRIPDAVEAAPQPQHESCFRGETKSSR